MANSKVMTYVIFFKEDKIMSRRRSQSRRNQNNMGSFYLVLSGIILLIIIIVYLGIIKDPTSNIERDIKKINLELNLDNKL